MASFADTNAESCAPMNVTFYTMQLATVVIQDVGLTPYDRPHSSAYPLHVWSANTREYRTINAKINENEDGIMLIV